MCLQSVAAIRRKTHQSICHVTKDQPVIIFQSIARHELIHTQRSSSGYRAAVLCVCIISVGCVVANGEMMQFGGCIYNRTTPI